MAIGAASTVKDDVAARAAALLRRCRVMALGTLSGGAPSVTMAPYAVRAEPFAFLLLVSGLASHTRDMLADPRVALMVMEPEGGEAAAHALPRVAVQGIARAVPPEAPAFEPARASYLERFPEMAGLFDLGDFRLFAIEPAAVRVVLGFAQAASVTPATLAAAFR